MKKILPVLLVAILMLFVQAFPALAASEQVEELSLQKAIERAFAHSVDLHNTEMDIEKKEISLDNVRWSMNGVMSGYNIPEETDREVHKTFFNADLDYRVTEKKLDDQKRKLKIDVKEAYYNILLADKEIANSKLRLAQTTIKHSQVNSKYKVGMATQLDVLTAQAQLEAEQTTLKEKNNDLVNAYSQLNKLVGNQQDARPVLTDSIEYTPVEELDVDREVLKAVNNSFEIWSATEAAKTAQNLKYYETFYDVGEYNESQARNTLADAKESIRLAARTYCLAIFNMQNQYGQLETQEKQLEEALKNITAQYQVGMVTKDAVDDIAVNLSNIKTAKEQLAAKHTKAREELQKLTGELDVTNK